MSEQAPIDPAADEPGWVAGSLSSHQLRAVAGGAGLITFGYGVYAILNLSFQLLIAHNLQPNDVGRYFEAVAIAGILLGLCTGGLVLGIVRFVATLEPSQANALVRRVLWLDAAVAVAIGAVLVISSPFIARHVFNDATLTTLLRITAASLPLGAISLILAGNARGRGVFRYHFLAEQVSLPAARLVLFAVLLGLGVGVRGATVAYVAGVAASAGVGFFGAHRIGVRLFSKDGPPLRHLARPFAVFSAYRWGVDFLLIVLLWADTLLLGAFRSAADVGVYSICARLVLFATVPLAALNISFAPTAARELEGQHLERLQHLYGIASRWSAILTAVPLALILALRTSVLGFFGQSFVRGSHVLVVLILGFALYGICGPVGTVIDMSSKNRLVLWDTLLAVAVNLSLNAVLIPLWGMIGAAAAWAASIASVNLVMLYQVRYSLGVPVFRRVQRRTALAIALVLFVAVLAQRTGAILASVLTILALAAAVSLTWSSEDLVWVRTMISSVRVRDERGRG